MGKFSAGKKKFLLPNVVDRIPPMIGSGIKAKKAPNFPTTPTTIRMHATPWMTSRLAT